MKIKFHETLYDLIDQPNVQPVHFQATIDKGEHSFDDLIADTADAEEITVYNDDEEVIGVYTGYTRRIAISIIEYVSVELANVDVEGQIDTLTNEVNNMHTEVEEMQTQVNSKVSSDVIADVETISGQSKNPYEVGDTFMGDDGNYYKAVATIKTGNILVVHGNIEPTTINETIKESEVTE